MINPKPLSIRENSFFELPKPSTEVSEVNFLIELDELDKRKNELLATQQKIQKLLNDIELREKEIKAQIASEKTILPLIEIIETPKKATKIAQSTLVVNTKQISKSKDDNGEWEHYSVSFISKNNEKIEINKYPIDVKKYGEIKHIIITDGENETELDLETRITQRLIKYFSTEFETFRKGINTLDHNGYYSNEYEKFDCQNFSYYLQHGKEGKYQPKWGLRTNANYRNNLRHTPGYCYSITAQTADFGKNGRYGGTDMCLHHYTCLTKDVFVSKFGASDVFFTSCKHILDAYFPEKFIKGNACPEIF